MTRPGSGRPGAWLWILGASGAAGLGYEVVWLRRTGLIVGGTAPAAAVTVGSFLGGLALGAALARSLPVDARRAARAYAALELAAAAWAVAFPALFSGAERAATWGSAAALVACIPLLAAPAAALGATWPLVARRAGSGAASALYAANTTGAVLGVLAATFAGLPLLGVRGTELACAAVGVAAAVLALRAGATPAESAAAPPERTLPARPLLAATFAAGVASIGLELVWFRLAAVALGATVYTTGLVLATFLATLAAGAWLGRTWPRDPVGGLGLGLAGVAVLALAGALAWGQLPYGMAALWRVGGPEALLPGSALLAAAAMGGAPAASGLAFSCAVRALGPELPRAAGSLYAANTVGSILGAFAGGLWALPVLEVRGAVALFAGCAAVAGSAVLRRPWPLLATGVLAVAMPSWDARLYAVGVHLRISDFADPSARAVRAFADEGWDLLSYDHGPTGAVAVGRSTRTGNTWLSVNGKVDASTGDDMPTQVLSGTLPVRAVAAERVLVVGLASGITAGAVLAEPSVQSLTVVEIEPAVVPASRYFDAVSGAPLDDARTTLVLGDARALLQRQDRVLDAIISEPSNPWITGVSSLFTLEYWQACRASLRPGGAMLQWVQLYGLGADELRGLVRTFQHVFGPTWVFETVPGSDLLLLGGVDALPGDLPIEPLLDPSGAARFAGQGWLNTDDRPRVELMAPRWLHYETAPRNRALLEAAR